MSYDDDPRFLGNEASPWRWRLAEYLYHRRRTFRLWFKEYVLRKELKWVDRYAGIIWMADDPNLLFCNDRYGYILRKHMSRFRYPTWYRMAKRKRWTRWCWLVHMASRVGLDSVADRWRWRIDPRALAPPKVLRDGFRYVLQPELTYPQAELLFGWLPVWQIPIKEKLTGAAYVPYDMYVSWFRDWEANGFAMNVEDE